MRGRSLTEVLKQAIRQSGESVNAVALASGVPQPVLHRFLAGERDLKLSTAEKLMNYFALIVTSTREVTTREANCYPPCADRPDAVLLTIEQARVNVLKALISGPKTRNELKNQFEIRYQDGGGYTELMRDHLEAGGLVVETSKKPGDRSKCYRLTDHGMQEAKRLS